MGVRL